MTERAIERGAAAQPLPAAAVCCSCGKTAAGWRADNHYPPECAPCLRGEISRAKRLAERGGVAASEWRFSAMANILALWEWYGEKWTGDAAAANGGERE